MTSALDMSLDDIIKSTKKSSGPSTRGRGGRGSGLGPTRRFFKRGTSRAAPYTKTGRAPQSTRRNEVFIGGAPAYHVEAAGSGSIETGTKLYISNLDYGVSNEDIKELFSEVGDLKRYSIHFDKSGRSKGTAEVVFSRRADAVVAIKRYHNVQLDGKPMKIEIVGTNIAASAAAPISTNGMFGIQNGGMRSWFGSGGATGGPSRCGLVMTMRGGRGRGRGRGRERGRGRGRGGRTPLSTEALDADLQKYHEQAKQSDGMDF